jgi:Zn-dependent protease with chaperone function
MIYLSVLVGTVLSILGVLVFLAVYLSPHWLMNRLGIGCVHGTHCFHGLPPWVQLGLWALAMALLGCLVWRSGWTMVSTLRAGRRLRRMALTHGLRVGVSAPFPVWEMSDSGVVACTLGIFRPLILVSTGLRSSLGLEEYEALLAHEQAHAAARDNLVLLLARVIGASLSVLPGVRQAHRGLRRSVEMAADAFASRRIGDRLVVASCLTRVANLVFESDSVDRACLRAAAASFGHEELVVERVRHLVLDNGPVCSRRRLLCAAVALIVLFSALGLSMSAVTGNNIVGGPQTTVCADTSQT